MRRRLNLVVDDDLLEAARKVSGKKTYTETIEHALQEIARVEKVKDFLTWFDDNKGDIFVPGYEEEFWIQRGHPEIARALRAKRSAKVVRAPRTRKS
jgi:hypothetical protein